MHGARWHLQPEPFIVVEFRASLSGVGLLPSWRKNGAKSSDLRLANSASKSVKHACLLPPIVRILAEGRRITNRAIELGLIDGNVVQRTLFGRASYSFSRICRLVEFYYCLSLSKPLRRTRFTLFPKIAIVDDSSAIRHLVRLLIESHTDWQVCGEADDGEAGVALVQQFKPDPLVLDLLMPVMNGFDAARKMAAISPKTRIGLFTGHADEQVLKEARSAGIRAMLTKDADNALLRLLAALHEANDTIQAA